MWTVVQLLCLCTLGVSLPPSNAPSSHLKFYKDIGNPWYIKDAPYCAKTSTLCPTDPSYTWDYYFDYLLGKGVSSFLLGGYSVMQGKIKTDSPPWDKAAFAALKQQVGAKGGRILANLGVFFEKSFDKAAFHESAREFIKDYPVDGFQVILAPSDSGVTVSLKELLEAINELNLHSAFSFSTDDWHRVNNSGLAKIADTNFVTIWPVDDDSGPVFNTDGYAHESLHNATLAGADPSSLVLTIPLLAVATYDSGTIGYSNAIYDFGGDPKGDGSIFLSSGIGAYFFSQPRATEKVTLAKNYGIYGIALEAGISGLMEDLFPWDKDSLFYALAASMKSTAAP
ncbi:hypothetical protein FOZ60_002615 [Perkinsus olseni]|uniref:Chitinase n=1 Tax=Perkinsus olseni TaxID=32597 RepID=A0A7J6NXM6_PEROL|nr:hypothetical protein FOZ60_002615 [Perkinsus olseni]